MINTIAQPAPTRHRKPSTIDRLPPALNLVAGEALEIIASGQAHSVAELMEFMADMPATVVASALLALQADEQITCGPGSELSYGARFFDDLPF